MSLRKPKGERLRLTKGDENDLETGLRFVPGRGVEEVVKRSGEGETVRESDPDRVF